MAEIDHYDYCAVLGDDIDLGFEKYVNHEAIYDAYDKLNFPIARDKTRVSKGWVA